MDLSKMSVTELKALVYDNLAQVEMCQNNMKIINQEIAKRSQEMKKEEPVNEVS